MNRFTVKSVNVSTQRGSIKRPVDVIICKKEHGVLGDGHAGPGLRQISLLAYEDIESMRAAGATVDCGDFAENITTTGIDLASLPIGARLTFEQTELEITQIGKECHSGCAIMRQVGYCIMPRRGVFAKVVKEGEIRRGSAGTYNF
ncbi:MAG: hypothetical protein JW768_06820 [Chitinispirillaceae bacterium]|nr:hypothetical protein [Chitinispirillaceae bacterium]